MRTLTSAPTLVESPFIIVKIGDFTFGNVQKTKQDNSLNVTFPEYMKSLTVVKVNGEVNTYHITMEYPITKGNDPNLIDYVFSSVSATRRLTISYGDWNSPSFIYKEENTLITNVTSSVSFTQPRITYNIDCVSDAKGLQSVNFSFPKRTTRPSVLIEELLRNSTYRLTDIFPGMSNMDNVKKYGLIEGGDKVVEIPAKVNCNIWDYLTYIVGFMLPEGTEDNQIATTCFYRIAVIDDNKNELNGAYFTVKRVSANNNVVIDDDPLNSSIAIGAYELDVGFPTNNFVTDFNLDNNQEWALLYNTANVVEARNYSYKITHTGQIVKNYSPTLTRTTSWAGTTAADKSWWSAVTSFPLRANITLKGLVRPTILMSYVKLNVLFYGQRHVSSGYYVIEKQEDTIDDRGYRTRLNLLRIKGDDDIVNEVTIKNNQTDPATGFNLDSNEGRNINYNSDLNDAMNPGSYLFSSVKSTRGQDTIQSMIERRNKNLADYDYYNYDWTMSRSDSRKTQVALMEKSTSSNKTVRTDGMNTGTQSSGRGG